MCTLTPPSANLYGGLSVRQTVLYFPVLLIQSCFEKLKAFPKSWLTVRVFLCLPTNPTSQF